MEILSTPIQPYVWGSHTTLAALQGRPATKTPEAELWVGAHPRAASQLVSRPGQPTLARIIAADPAGELGMVCRGRFGDRLPFLLKVLAVEAPLSIQVHPDADQAKAGYMAEEASGIRRDAPERNYVDTSHKPELLYALSTFSALCGFRPPEQAREVLRALHVSELEPLVDLLVDTAGLAEVFSRLITCSAELVGKVTAACEKAPDSPFAAAYQMAVELAKRYPGDVGVVVTLLLNHVELKPGQAMFVPAGALHAYLSGTAIEVMASSDNVLRGGLTPKHVDVPELLRVVRPDVQAPHWIEPVELSPGISQWRPPVAEFTLTRVIVSGPSVRVPVQGAQLLLCMDGELTAENRLDREPAERTQDPISLRGGQAAYCGASDGELSLVGHGVAFVASPADIVGP